MVRHGECRTSHVAATGHRPPATCPLPECREAAASAKQVSRDTLFSDDEMSCLRCSPAIFISPSTQWQPAPSCCFQLGAPAMRVPVQRSPPSILSIDGGACVRGRGRLTTCQAPPWRSQRRRALFLPHKSVYSQTSPLLPATTLRKVRHWT